MSEFKNNPLLNTRQAAQSLGVHPETFQNQLAAANAESDAPRRRRRYQPGTLVLKKRKPGPNGENRNVWYIRFIEWIDGRRKRVPKYVGTFTQYPSRDAANIAAGHLRLAANAEHPRPDISMGEFMDRYEAEILRPALVPVGAEENPIARVSYNTAKGYKSSSKVWIRPRWERYKVSDFERKEMWEAVEKWLRECVWRSDANPTGLAPMSTTFIRDAMYNLFKFAVKWGYLTINPLAEKRVELPRGHSIRTKTAPQLTPAQFRLLFSHLCLMARAAVALAGWCTGPREHEIFGLKWQNTDFKNRAVNFVQGWTGGRINHLKTEPSRTNLPLPQKVVEVLREWRSVTPFNRPEDWIFASVRRSGKHPVNAHNFLEKYIRPVALSLGLPRVSWHSFRHSVNAWAKNADMTADQRKILLRQESSEVNDKYGIVELEKKRELQQRIEAYFERDSLGTTEPTPADTPSSTPSSAAVGANVGDLEPRAAIANVGGTPRSGFLPCSTGLPEFRPPHYDTMGGLGWRTSASGEIVPIYPGRRKWDYDAIAQMWVDDRKTIRQIALAVGAVDKDAKDPFYRIRCLLWRMKHKGYRDESGRLVKLTRRGRQAIQNTAPALHNSISAQPTDDRQAAKYNFRGKWSDTVWEIVQRMDVDKSFTVQKLVENMRGAGCPFSDNPCLTINTALYSLRKAGLIKVTKWGRGRRPTSWKTVTQTALAN